jgi:hypothetical protein
LLCCHEGFDGDIATLRKIGFGYSLTDRPLRLGTRMGDVRIEEAETAWMPRLLARATRKSSFPRRLAVWSTKRHRRRRAPLEPS